MIKKYVWTIFITYAIAGTFGIAAGMSDLPWWGYSIGGAVSFGICLYVWWRKIR